MGAALFIGFSLQIIGLQYTTPSKNCVPHSHKCGYCSFYCFSDLPEKSRIQRYNRSSAGHRGGGTFVPG